MSEYIRAIEDARALEAFSKTRRVTLVETGPGYVVLEYVSALAGTRKRYDSREPLPEEVRDFVNGYEGKETEKSSYSFEEGRDVAQKQLNEILRLPLPKETSDKSSKKNAELENLPQLIYLLNYPPIKNLELYEHKQK